MECANYFYSLKIIALSKLNRVSEAMEVAKKYLEDDIWIDSITVS